MRRSADLVGRTLAEVGRIVRPGVKTSELDAVAEAYIRKAGASPAFKGYKVGRHVFPAALCISINDVVVHGIPGDRVLEEGDLVSVDCGVLLNGYFGDSAYTFAVGALDAEKQQLAQVTYEALHKGIAQATAGNRIGNVAHAVQVHSEAAGFGVVHDLVGHGIGRKLHEDPQVPNVGSPGTGRRMRAGLVICIEPMINAGTPEVETDPDGWTVRSADGSPSAHYEHMVVVKHGEPEVLSTFAYIEDVVAPPYQVQEHYGKATVY